MKRKTSTPEFIQLGEVVLRRDRIVALVPGHSNGQPGTWAIIDGYAKMIWIENDDDLPLHLL